MTAKLKEALRNIAPKTITENELEQGVLHLMAYAKCLLKMRQEILENESNNINSCFNEDAGRRLEPACSK